MSTNNNQSINMLQGSDGFMFPYDWRERMSALTDSQFRELINAAIDYASDGLMPNSDDPIVQSFFPVLQTDLDTMIY